MSKRKKKGSKMTAVFDEIKKIKKKKKKDRIDFVVEEWLASNLCPIVQWECIVNMNS